MEILTLPFIKPDDPRLTLKVENRMRNIFVTQLEEPREDENENIKYIPVINEASSKILQTGVNTLQKTLVLKREVEVEDINRQLTTKRQEFANRMEALARRKAEFELKQKLTKERALKFDKFLQDNESKRRRALRNYQMERKHNELKEKEIQDLLQELEKLQVRQQHLKKKVVKNKMHEDYLLKIIDHLPENYLEYGADSLVMPIIRRHETLAVTNEALVRQLSSLSEELEKSQHKLESLHQEHDTNKLDISQRYASIRRIKGDGNCFYRALSFGHLESLLENARGLQFFKETLQQSRSELLSAGFDENRFTDLLNTFVCVIEQTQEGGQGSTLLNLFNDQTTSDAIVHYLRLLTSAYIQNHADFFQHFVEAPNLKDYCNQEVEAMAMECDHLEILALSQALGVGIKIECMEGNSGLNHHIIPEGTQPTLHFLYKTSHYDILYENKQ